MKALDRVAAHHYDAIVSDVNMPGLNGLQFLKRVREIQPFAQVVLISGHTEQGVVSKAIEAGAADFLAKPIERDLFICTLRRTLNVSRLRELSERQEVRIARTRDHYMSLVQKLGQSNERLRGLIDDRPGFGVISDDARIRRQRAERQIQYLAERATRHLNVLDAFLCDATEIQRQTSMELTTAQEKLRRLALTRL